jgi:hypothetical protein
MWILVLLFLPVLWEALFLYNQTGRDSPFKAEAQTALFKDPVRTAL